jgi:hypothetical protein
MVARGWLNHSLAARFVYERGDELNPLLVAVRQRVQAIRRPFGQAQALKPGIQTAGHVFRPAPAHLAEIHQLVPHADGTQSRCSHQPVPRANALPKQ